MFFLLAKILGFFLVPSNAVLILGLTGLVLMRTRYAPAGRALAATSLLLIAVVGLGPVGDALIEPLEDRFPPWDPGRGAPDGIVVLGGAADPEFLPTRGRPDLNEAAERIVVIAELARAYPQARIVYSGGNAAVAPTGGSEAEAVAPIFASFGIAPDRLVLETRSRNTAENARYTHDVVAPHGGERWLLVTSAYHMPRAVGAFRKAGFDVEAYPVDYRTHGPVDRLTPFADVGSGLRRTDAAAHEWIGLIAYWLAGRSSELFPRPAGS
jgi:uncharacterized SAM-binding protein YcdF (DUF218 family)